MYSILLSKKVIKFLRSLSSKHQKIIRSKFELLRSDPYYHPKLDLKKMKGKDEFYRLRVGKIRFIFEVDNEKVIILVFAGGKRGDVYKKK